MTPASRKTQWEAIGLVLVAALVIGPAVVLALLAFAGIRKAQDSIAEEIRQAHSRTADAIASQSLSELDAEVDKAAPEIARFAARPSAETRLAISRKMPFLEAIVLLDDRSLRVYPTPEADVSPSQPDMDPESPLLEARQLESRGDVAAASDLYRKSSDNADLGQLTSQMALSGLARCLALGGKTADAIAEYSRLAGAPGVRSGELLLPLLARLRMWQLDPSDDRRLSLLQACVDAPLATPLPQLRYYRFLLGNPPDDRSKTAVATLDQLIAARTADNRLSQFALYAPAAGAGADGTGANASAWRAFRDGDKQLLIRTGGVGEFEGAAVAAILSFDLEKTAATIIAPLLESHSADDSITFLLKNAGAPPDEAIPVAGPETIVERPFPPPFDFWSISVTSAEGALEDLARSRVAVMSTAILLAAGGVIVGVCGLFFWASRRARLARLQTDFIANVTHELKTPLTAIRSLAETVELKRLTSPERQDEFLAAIVQETERLSRLINNVLDFSRLENGRQRLRLEKADLAGIVSKSVASFTNIIPADEQSCLALSSIQGPVPAVVDPDCIARALHNLLDNAYKYSNPPRRIKVSLDVRQGRAVISVSDNGIGLTPAQARRVWRKFYRVDTSLAASTQGTGLGLPLVKAYVEAHGGRVEVRSQPGKGSTFSISLPLDAEVGK